MYYTIFVEDEMFNAETILYLKVTCLTLINSAVGIYCPHVRSVIIYIANGSKLCSNYEQRSQRPGKWHIIHFDLFFCE